MSWRPTPVSEAREALEPLDSPPPPAPGLVVQPDVDSLVRAVESVLLDPERRRSMSVVARVRSRTRFSRKRMLVEWERALEGG